MPAESPVMQDQLFQACPGISFFCTCPLGGVLFPADMRHLKSTVCVLCLACNAPDNVAALVAAWGVQQLG